MIKVQYYVCNPFQELCYVVYDEASLHCVIIDPGCSTEGEWNRIDRFIVERHLVPDYVLLTHGHTDHVMGTGYVSKAYPGIPIVGSVEEQNHLPPVVQQNHFFGIESDAIAVPITHGIAEGDELTFPCADSSTVVPHNIQVIDCPGHSHHGLCYYFAADGLLFSGDVLFYGSVGRSDLGPSMGCNGPLLAQGIVQKLFVLPPEVRVYPGHGPHTTIGDEIHYNPYV